MNLQKSAGNVKVEPDHFAITHQHDDAIVISSSDEDTESDMECSSQQPFKATVRRIIRPRILTKTTPGGGCHKIWITDESDDNEQYELQDNADEIDTEYGLEDNSDADESSLSSLHSDKFEKHGWFSNSSDNNDSDRDMDFDFPSENGYESDNGSDDHSSDLDIVNDTSSDTNAPRSGDGYQSDDHSSLPDLVNDTSSDSNMDFHNATRSGDGYESDDHSSDIDLVNDTSSDNDTADSIPPNRLLCISSQGVIKLQVMA